MNILIKGKQKNIAVVDSEEILISDSTSALDMAMSIQYEANTSDIVIPKQCIIEDFFQLSTKLAGEILQKYMNYGIRIAIVGDFSEYKSKALKDFIYESNKGKYFFFVLTEQDAIEKLESTKNRV